MLFYVDRLHLIERGSAKLGKEINELIKKVRKDIGVVGSSPLFSPTIHSSHCSSIHTPPIRMNNSVKIPKWEVCEYVHTPFNPSPISSSSCPIRPTSQPSSPHSSPPTSSSAAPSPPQPSHPCPPPSTPSPQTPTPPSTSYTLLSSISLLFLTIISFFKLPFNIFLNCVYILKSDFTVFLFCIIFYIYVSFKYMYFLISNCLIVFSI